MTIPPRAEPGEPQAAGPQQPPSRLPALGRRGGGWVALQVLVFALAAGLGWFGMRWPVPAAPWLWAGAGVAFVGGSLLLLAGGAGLGGQLTPFPRPVDTGELREGGIYGHVRHPIYGGVLLLLLAWALASSPTALVACVLAAGFFDAKRRREEAWLLARYPGYPAYRGRVTRSFIPFVW